MAMLGTKHYSLQALLSAKIQILQKAQNPVEQITQLGFVFRFGQPNAHFVTLWEVSVGVSRFLELVT